jgi:hypothetical protein
VAKQQMCSPSEKQFHQHESQTRKEMINNIVASTNVRKQLFPSPHFLGGVADSQAGSWLDAQRKDVAT